MLDAHPQAAGIEIAVLADALDALKEGAQVSVADADLVEPTVADMVKCIRLCIDCVNICRANVGVLSRPTNLEVDVTKPLLKACVAICKACGEECERHAQRHDHCRICADAFGAAGTPADS